MGGSGSLAEFLTGCIMFLALALYFSCRQCVKLKEENRILRWFFEQQAHMDIDQRRAYQAMSVEAARAKARATASAKSKIGPSPMI